MCVYNYLPIDILCVCVCVCVTNLETRVKGLYTASESRDDHTCQSNSLQRMTITSFRCIAPRLYRCN